MIVKSKEIEHALSTISRWVPQKPKIQIFGGILLEIYQDSISVSATDGESSDVFLNIPGRGGKPGSIVVAGKKFNSIISSVSKSDDEITLEISSGGRRALKILCGTHSTSVMELGTKEDFPHRIAEDSGDQCVIESELFKEFIKSVEHIADPDNPMPILSGVHFEDGDVVTADGNRMMIRSGLDLYGSPITIPVDSCKKMAYAIPDNVDISAYRSDDSRRLSFSWDGGSVGTTVLNKEYPKYRLILPEKNQSNVTLKRDEFALAVTVAGELASEMNNLIVLERKAEYIEVWSRSEIGDSRSLVKILDIDGEIDIIGTSYVYMLNAIKSFSGNNINLGINGGSGPIVLSDTTDRIYVVMPMHISSSAGSP